MHIRRLSLGRWSRHWLLGFLAVFVPLLFLSGCQSDDITSYQAPKTVALARLGEPVRARMIVAVLEHGEQWWVFKLLAAEKRVAPVVKEFDTFLDSVQVTDKEGKPIQWKLPDNWKEQPGDNFAYATLNIDAGDTNIPVTVTRMGKQEKLANINRWRGQLGLDPISEKEVDDAITPIKINGENGFRLDLVGGPKASRAKAAPAAANAAPPKDALKYKTPDGWKELGPDASGLRYAGFSVEKDQNKALVTIVPLPGKSGTLLDNVNRWRKQITLKEIDDDQLKKEIKADKIGGAEAQYVKLVGEKDAILGFIVKRGEVTWFFKMSGPKDFVEKQEAVFVEFCRSVEF